MEILFQAAKIIIQTCAYLASLAWLAWRGERSRGSDAFHLVVAYAAGIWLLSLFIEKFALNEILAMVIASVVAYVIDRQWIKRPGDTGSNESLVQVIVVASLALIAFDWATSNTPVSLPIRSIGVSNAALLGALVAWTGILFASRSRASWIIRLGIRNRWAMEYWGRPLPTPSIGLSAIGVLCWVTVLTIPMATTGLLSATILKDVSIAILIARVASSRGPKIIFAACITLAILRTGVGFFVLSNAGPPLVEATIFLCLLLWLRYRSSRTVWESANVH